MYEPTACSLFKLDHKVIKLLLSKFCEDGWSVEVVKIGMPAVESKETCENNYIDLNGKAT